MEGLQIFDTTSCVISIDFEKDTQKYVVYVLDRDNHWFFLTTKNDLANAVYFSRRFFTCHPHYTRLSINFLKVV